MECACGYQFALDPKSDWCTDKKMLRWIAKASNNGTYFFTEDQLFTTVCQTRSLAGKIVPLIIGSAILVFAGILYFRHLKDVGWIAVPLIFTIVALGFTIVGLMNNGFQYITRKTFDGWLTKYTKLHPIKKLVKTARLLEPPPNWGEADIYDYGVERVFLMQRDLLVDLFVLNHQHVDNRALVVSEDGYPSYLQEKFKQLLTSSPELPIFLFHDATDDGEQWAELMMKKYRNNGREVVDAGVDRQFISKVGKVKHVPKKSSQNEAPIDILPMSMICNGVALCAAGNVPFTSLMEDAGSADGASCDFG